MTSLPPDDDHRYLYTYWGRRIQRKGSGLTTHPLYVYDGVRGRPLFIMGANSTARTNFLINLALKDASCGRPVVFIDGTPQPETLDKLHYWCRIKAGRKFYALTPFHDDKTHTWNPFYAPKLKPTALTDSLFNGYLRSLGKGFRNQREIQFQKDCFGLLMRALHTTERVCNSIDLVNILTKDFVFDQLDELLKRDGSDYHEDVKKLKDGDPRYIRKMAGLTQFFRNMSHWSLNSYSPSILLENLWQDNPVYYFALPKELGDGFTCGLGNVILQQLKALNATVESSERLKRKSILVILNSAERFLDKDLGEWLCNIRLSSLLITTTFQRKADLNLVSTTFADGVMKNDSNLLMFNPHDLDTANWFAERLAKDATENKSKSDLAGTDINSMPDGHYLLRTPTFYVKTILAQSPLLDAIPPRPEFLYHKEHYNLREKPKQSGLWTTHFKERPKPANEPEAETDENEFAANATVE